MVGIPAKPPEALARLSVAPMMDWTDRHCRFFHRQLNAEVKLYSEMVTTGAVIHGDREHLLGFDAVEHPLALQLGGSEPEALARAARIGADYGYDEINLNLGCPSERVQKGAFGACLMKEPELVRDCLNALREAVDIPVTVKTRIGVDEQDSEAFLDHFIATLAESGVRTFIIHARKAWLKGLSPKQNREIPPLMYDRVYRLRAVFPDLHFILNGGLNETEAALNALQRVEGIMLGRAAYQDPWILVELGQRLGQPVAESRAAVIQTMVDYAADHIRRGGRLQQVARHMLGLFHAQPGARRWRQLLSQNMHRADAGPELLLQALPERLAA